MQSGNKNDSWLLSFGKRAFTAAVATSFAELCTIPLDTAKVRLQIQGQLGKGKGVGSSNPNFKPYTGMFNTLGRIAKTEGFAGLFVGITPAIFRQLTYGTARLALYQPIRNFYDDKYREYINNTKTDSPFGVKVLAGFTSGAIAICFGQPSDIIKIRFQADPTRYSSFFQAIYKIPMTDGILGLWKGIAPNIARNSVINTAELAVYDQIKETLLSTGYMNDGSLLHATVGFFAGFCAVIFGSPFDVVKTRIMQSERVDGQSIYRNTPHAFYKIMRTEGPLAFYQGFWPNVMRIGSWATVMFLTFEQVSVFVYGEKIKKH
mmetsp:Transcript_83952/g.102835  ORF Transcript_83952/g.102835 Transcript_83952/m.102835 type:complete len:319 (-) Transcript_83952:74-1030(-)